VVARRSNARKPGLGMKTIVSAWVDVDVAARLVDAAAKRQTTRSAIVAFAVQHFLTEHPDVVVLPERGNTPRGGTRSDRDGLDKAARAIIQADPRRTIRTLQHALADAGIRRSVGWISNARATVNSKPIIRS
jgi:hypothetical protein